jgi:hypothetical protein
MANSIEFDREMRFDAVEIEDVRTHRMLAPEYRLALHSIA